MGYGRVYKIYTYINEYLIGVLYSRMDDRTSFVDRVSDEESSCVITHRLLPTLTLRGLTSPKQHSLSIALDRRVVLAV